MKLYLAGLCGFSLFELGMALLQPWPFTIVVDSIFGQQPLPGWLEAISDDRRQLLVLMIVVSIGVFFLNSLEDYVSNRLSMKVNFLYDSKVRTRLFRSIMKIPDKDNTIPVGDLTYRLNSDSQAYADLKISQFVEFFETIVTAVVVFVIMFMMSPWLTIFVVIMSQTLQLTFRYFNPILTELASQTKELGGETSGYSTELIGKTRLIQLYSKGTEVSEKFRDYLQKNYDLGLKKTIVGFWFGATNGFISLMMNSMILLIGGMNVLDGGGLTIGTLLLFMTYQDMLVGPLTSFSTMMIDRNELKESVSRVEEIFEHAEKIETIDAKKLPNQSEVFAIVASPSIEVKNMYYTIKGRQIFKGANLKIPPRQKAAIVGPSGVGKSTLFNLMLGFDEPQFGAIYANDKNIMEFPMRQRRDLFSVVDQQSDLITGSVYENISMGLYLDSKDEHAQKTVHGSAYYSNASSFIEQLPEGMHTNIGDSGVFLSGGQKQRISLARAIARNAPYLLLDEPTSALDEGSSQYVMKILNSVFNDKTVLMVTHDLDLLEYVDQVYVLTNGLFYPIEEYGGVDSYKDLIRSFS